MVVSATVILKDEAHSVLSGSTGSLLEGLGALSLTPYSSALSIFSQTLWCVSGQSIIEHSAAGVTRRFFIIPKQKDVERVEKGFPQRLCHILIKACLGALSQPSLACWAG